MKKLLMLAILLTGTLTFAQNKSARATIEVDGVCGMCKNRIEKACVKTKGIKSAVWNVDTHELKLIFDERKTNLATIHKSIAAIGHDTKLEKAPQEAYDALHGCCKYRNEEIREDHKKEKQENEG